MTDAVFKLVTSQLPLFAASLQISAPALSPAEVCLMGILEKSAFSNTSSHLLNIQNMMSGAQGKGYAMCSVKRPVLSTQICFASTGEEGSVCVEGRVTRSLNLFVLSKQLRS